MQINPYAVDHHSSSTAADDGQIFFRNVLFGLSVLAVIVSCVIGAFALALWVDPDLGVAFLGVLVSAFILGSWLNETLKRKTMFFDCARAWVVGGSRGYNVRGVASLNRRRLQAAMADFDLAIERNPNFATAYHHRSIVWLEHTSEYQQAIELAPQHPNAYKNLAWQLATCPYVSHRDGIRAIELATKALELSEWKQSDWFSILAAAYAEAGEFDSAIEWQQKAITETSDGETALTLYEVRSPLREN